MNMKNTFINKQKGAALILSLLILLVMTLIGVTAMQTTTMEERMAGNMNEMNIALQSAEATLRAGEADLEALFSTADFSATGGTAAYAYKFTQGNAPDPFTTALWDDTDSKPYDGTSPGGRYFIEKIGTLDLGGSDEQCIDEHGEPCTGSTTTMFRVTARSTGKSGTAIVVLQSHYGK